MNRISYVHITRDESRLYGLFFYSTVIFTSSPVWKLTLLALVPDMISSINIERSVFEVTLRCTNSVHSHNCFSVLYPRTFSMTVSSSSTAAEVVVISCVIGKISPLGKDKI